jgi:hypothetical protein
LKRLGHSKYVKKKGKATETSQSMQKKINFGRKKENELPGPSVRPSIDVPGGAPPNLDISLVCKQRQPAFTQDFELSDMHKIEGNVKEKKTDWSANRTGPRRESRCVSAALGISRVWGIIIEAGVFVAASGHEMKGEKA